MDAGDAVCLDANLSTPVFFLASSHSPLSSPLLLQASSCLDKSLARSATMQKLRRSRRKAPSFSAFADRSAI